MKATNLNTSTQVTYPDNLLCLNCESTEPVSVVDNTIQCSSCNHSYPIHHGVIDCLHEPVEATVNELKGMALENNIKEDDYLDFKVRLLENPPAFSDKLQLTSNDHSHYYLQTKMHFDQAMAQLPEIKPGDRVLEIGACHDYYFLKPFHDQGAQCFALNIHFDLDQNNPSNWPYKILGDMNSLPFLNESFDYIVISATSHHSTTPEILSNEIYRVLKPGGCCLMINDPTWGIVKNLGGPDNTQAFRESHINENEYPIWRYNKMFKRSGFRYQHLFSSFYDQKLLNSKIHPDTRFAFIAKIVKKVWVLPFFRNLLKDKLLWVAQAILGFPMNVILTKPSQRKS